MQNDQLAEAVERMENFGCVTAEDLSTEQLRQEIADLQVDVSEARDHLDTLVQIKTQLEYAIICVTYVHKLQWLYLLFKSISVVR